VSKYTAEEKAASIRRARFAANPRNRNAAGASSRLPKNGPCLSPPAPIGRLQHQACHLERRKTARGTAVRLKHSGRKNFARLEVALRLLREHFSRRSVMPIMREAPPRVREGRTQGLVSQLYALAFLLQV
jgi:hypothetical protein